MRAVLDLTVDAEQVAATVVDRRRDVFRLDVDERCRRECVLRAWRDRPAGWSALWAHSEHAYDYCFRSTSASPLLFPVQWPNYDTIQTALSRLIIIPVLTSLAVVKVRGG